MYLFRSALIKIARPAFRPTRQYFSSDSTQNDTKKRNPNDKAQLIVRGSFEDIPFKNRDTYLTMVQVFESKNIHRRNHVEFIYAALRNMEPFGVHRDIEVYKALMNVLPKGKFIPTNIFQSEFMHYPKQQQVIIDLLEQMEDNGNVACFRVLVDKSKYFFLCATQELYLTMKCKISWSTHSDAADIRS